MTQLPLDSIEVGNRVRKDMGNLTELAASIARHGLLHPVVVKPDNTLIAGHRRIEAVRILGWEAIPVTVIEVTDLLSAERDENAERKDFTPTEAVAIGRLIEEQHKAKIAAQEFGQKSRAGKLSAAKRSGNSLVECPPDAKPAGDTREIASSAVGMGGKTYYFAKAIVEAAESEPEKFGDLPSVMDETKNVAGTFKEMQRRKGVVAPKKSTLGQTGKNFEKNEERTFRAGIWQQVKDSLIHLTSLPAADEVVKIVRAQSRDTGFVDKKLPIAANWIKEFSDAWSKGNEATQ